MIREGHVPRSYESSAKTESGVDVDTQALHSLCMSTKTISLRIEAYEKLRRSKRLGESFSDVVMRARWSDETITAGELLRQRREDGPLLTADDIERLEKVVSEDRPPEDKWPTR